MVPSQALRVAFPGRPSDLSQPPGRWCVYLWGEEALSSLPGMGTLLSRGWGGGSGRHSPVSLLPVCGWQEELVALRAALLLQDRLQDQTGQKGFLEGEGGPAWHC